MHDPPRTVIVDADRLVVIPRERFSHPLPQFHQFGRQILLEGGHRHGVRRAFQRAGFLGILRFAGFFTGVFTGVFTRFVTGVLVVG